MEDDEKVQIYNRGVKEGQKHAVPSPLTKNFMERTKEDVTNMKIHMAEIKTDICYIKDSMKQNDSQHKEIIGKIDSFIQAADDRFADKADHKETIEKMDKFMEDLDDKYAPKITYTIMVWAAGVIGTAVLIGIVTLIYRVAILIEK